MVKSYCLMSYNGGGYTAFARVKQGALATSPPSINSAQYPNWNAWKGHVWRSASATGDNYYHSLDHFDDLTGTDTDVVQMNRDGAGAVTGVVTYSKGNFHATQNSFTFATCAAPGGQCTSSYSWQKFPPGFDGTGISNSCMNQYGSDIYNYHNFAHCASDSGLFAFNQGTLPSPQLLGSYTSTAPETLFLVRDEVSNVVTSQNPCQNSCKDILQADSSSPDGEYDICAPGGTFTNKVYCLMSWDGGGWTAIADVKSAANMNPPSIGSAQYDNWQQWRGHGWREGGSYYLSLDDFGALTQTATELVQMNSDLAIAVTPARATKYSNPLYDSVNNQFSFDACTGSQCDSAYRCGVVWWQSCVCVRVWRN
jgi:hypothetical protein